MPLPSRPASAPPRRIHQLAAAPQAPTYDLPSVSSPKRPMRSGAGYIRTPDFVKTQDFAKINEKSFNALRVDTFRTPAPLEEDSRCGSARERSISRQLQICVKAVGAEIVDNLRQDFTDFAANFKQEITKQLLELRLNLNIGAGQAEVSSPRGPRDVLDMALSQTPEGEGAVVKDESPAIAMKICAVQTDGDPWGLVSELRSAQTSILEALSTNKAEVNVVQDILQQRCGTSFTSLEKTLGTTMNITHRLDAFEVVDEGLHCGCGGAFLADSEFCHGCGAKRPTSICNCGHMFMPDAAFCRKCGEKRPGAVATVQDELTSLSQQVESCMAELQESIHQLKTGGVKAVDVDFSFVLQAIRDHEVDFTPVLEAISNEGKIDLVNILDAVHSERRLDITRAAEAIDLSPILLAIADHKADLQQVLNTVLGEHIRKAHEHRDGTSKFDLSPVLAAIASHRTDFPRLLNTVVDEAVRKISTENSLSSAAVMTLVREYTSGSYKVLEDLAAQESAAKTQVSNFKMDDVIEEIRGTKKDIMMDLNKSTQDAQKMQAELVLALPRSFAEIDFSPVIDAIREVKPRINVSELLEDIQKVKLDVDLTAALEAISGVRSLLEQDKAVFPTQSPRTPRALFPTM